MICWRRSRPSLLNNDSLSRVCLSSLSSFINYHHHHHFPSFHPCLFFCLRFPHLTYSLIRPFTHPLTHSLHSSSHYSQIALYFIFTLHTFLSLSLFVCFSFHGLSFFSVCVFASFSFLFFFFLVALSLQSKLNFLLHGTKGNARCKNFVRLCVCV